MQINFTSPNLRGQFWTKYCNKHAGADVILISFSGHDGHDGTLTVIVI